MGNIGEGSRKMAVTTLMQVRFFRYQPLMAVDLVRVPISLVLHIFEEADSEGMECVQDCMVIVGTVFIDDQAARF